MNKQAILTGLRLYIRAVGLAVLGYAVWQCGMLLLAPNHGGSDPSRLWKTADATLPYVAFVCFLLIPWWQMGDVTRTLGYAIAVPSCAYLVVGFLIVDIIYFHQKILFQSFLLSGLLAQILLLFIPMAEEIRNQDAEICKRRLRQSHRNKLALVEQFILEVEGEDHDPAVWAETIDTANEEALKRLDRIFESWLRKTERRSPQRPVMLRRHDRGKGDTRLAGVE